MTTAQMRRARVVDLGIRPKACPACREGALQVTTTLRADGGENREERCVNCGRIFFADDPIGR